MNPETKEILREMRGTRNWMHSKFYNLDNFWKKYDIHFKRDLLTHEDICVSSQINCACIISGKEPSYFDIFTYYWMSRPTTISREEYDGYEFLEVFFKDYIESTGYTYYKQYYKYGIDEYYTFASLIEVLMYCYFYMQGFKFHHPKAWIRDNEQHVRDYLILIKETFKVTNEDILNFSRINDADLFIKVRESANVGVGTFIETETFGQFLDILHKDIPVRETMSQVMRKGKI